MVLLFLLFFVVPLVVISLILISSSIMPSISKSIALIGSTSMAVGSIIDPLARPLYKFSHVSLLDRPFDFILKVNAILSIITYVLIKGTKFSVVLFEQSGFHFLRPLDNILV